MISPYDSSKRLTKVLIRREESWSQTHITKLTFQELMSSFELSKYGEFPRQLVADAGQVSRWKEFLKNTFISDEQSDFGRIRNKLLMGAEKQSWERFFFFETDFYESSFLKKTSERKLTEKLICWWILVSQRVSDKPFVQVIRKLDEGMSRPVMALTAHGATGGKGYTKYDRERGTNKQTDNQAKRFKVFDTKSKGYGAKTSPHLEQLERDIQSKIREMWNRDLTVSEKEVKEQNFEEVFKHRKEILEPSNTGVKTPQSGGSQNSNFAKLRFTELRKFFYNATAKKPFPHPKLKNAHQQISRSGLQAKIKTLQPVIFKKSKFAENEIVNGKSVVDSLHKSEINTQNKENFMLPKRNISMAKSDLETQKRFWSNKGNIKKRSLEMPLVGQFVRNHL